jgi:hypothetical protein
MKYAFVDVTTGWRTPAWRAGVRSAGHNLRCAYAIAALRRSGDEAVQVVQRRLGRLTELAEDIRRVGADTVLLWAPEPAPPLVAALEALLDGDVRRVGPDDLDGDASPWLDGVLPASAASVGVDVDRGRALEELAWLDAHVAEATLVPLHGDAWRRELLEPRFKHLTLSLAAVGEPDPELIALLAAGGGRVRLDRDDPRWLDLGVPVDVEHELPSEPDDLDALEARLAELGSRVPDLRYTWSAARRPPRLAVPELVRSPSYREEAALERGVHQRALRLHEGLYTAADGYARGVLDLMWAREDSPAEHAGWLAEVLAPTGVIFTAGDVGAGGPVAEVWPIVDGRLPSGDAVDVLAYEEAARRAPERPTVLALDDLDALLADADEAHETGELPAALAGGLTHVQHAVLWTAPDADATARLPRAWVDEAGVRAVPGGPVCGAVGDALETLLDRAQPLPEWLTPEALHNAHAEHPWLPAFAAAPLARRRVAEVLGPQAAGALRISGLGGNLLYPEGTPLARRVLLGAGDAFVLLDPATGALTRLKPDVAAIWEALACTQDPAAVCGWLARERGLEDAKARALVGALLTRLGDGLRPRAEVTA